MAAVRSPGRLRGLSRSHESDLRQRPVLSDLVFDLTDAGAAAGQAAFAYRITSDTGTPISSMDYQQINVNDAFGPSLDNAVAKPTKDVCRVRVSLGGPATWAIDFVQH